MALTEIPIELSSTPGIVDNSNATAITIDSSENVGIGTASPAQPLEILKTSAAAVVPMIQLRNGSSSAGSGTSIKFMHSTVSNATSGTCELESIRYSGNLGALTFKTSNNGGTVTERMRVDDTGVGIGVDSPSAELHVKNAADCTLLLQSGDGSTAEILFGDASDTSRGKIKYLSSDEMTFEVNNLSEAMRISGGNLLVGKTSDAINVAGVVNYNAGIVRASRNGNSGQFGRISTDGDIVTFYKDTVTVGSIGTISSDLEIHSTVSGHVGLRFANGGIFPTDNSGTVTDGAADIGNGSFRFKDLYLSGGAYLGGTAAANKLDDYEEGTWTPTINLGTISATEATYTKIGNLVTVRANISDISDNTSATDIEIGGLPFSSKSTNRSAGAALFRYFSRTNAAQINTYVHQSASVIDLYWSFNADQGWDKVQFADGTRTEMDIILTVSYITS
jgi:hypothetical protein